MRGYVPSETQTAVLPDRPLPGVVVAMLDDQLRIALGAPLLGRYLAVSGPVEGHSLVDLLADAEAVQSLRWVLEGVITRANILTLPGGEGQLVAEMALVGGERWVLLRVRPPVAAGSTIVPRRIGGRGAELAAFEAFLSGRGATDPRSIFFVEGPLGIGKTTLLAAFRARCEAIGCLSFALDANALAPSDSEILAALYPDASPGVPALASLFATATKLAARRWVLLIDNFDAWTRQPNPYGQLFAFLPDTCRIVVAARRRPKRSWWGDAPRAITQCTVGPLSEIDALHMARTLDVDVVARARGLRRAMGHPLSIVSLARTLGSDADRDADALDRITFETRGWLTRDMMELGSLPVRITEDLLGELLEDDEAAAKLYDTLTETCMRGSDDVGLTMPEAIRQVLRDTLRRRNPGRFTTLQRRLALYYAKRLEDGGAAYAPTLVDDLVETLAEHPALTQVFGDGNSDIVVRRTEDVDLDEVRAALVALGDRATADELMPSIAVDAGTSYLVSRGQTIVAVVHASSRGTEGRRRTAAQLVLRRVTEDLANASIIHVVAREDQGDWTDVSQALARILFGLTLSSRRVHAIVLLAEGQRRARFLPWGDAVTSEGFHVSIHDTRKLTPRFTVEELLASTPGSLSVLFAPTSSSAPPFALVSTDDLRFALTNLERPELLATSSLASLEICAGDDPTGNLQTLLRQILQTMNDTVTDRRLAEILTAVYVEKIGKHEQIAIDFGIPYGTFRRHMTRGLERARELLTLRMNAFLTSEVKRSEARSLEGIEPRSPVSAGEQ